MPPDEVPDSAAAAHLAELTEVIDALRQRVGEFDRLVREHLNGLVIVEVRTEDVRNAALGSLHR